MKTKLLLAIFSLFLIACSEDDLKELTRQNQNFVLTQSAPVSAIEGGPLTYSFTKEFDATDDVFVFTDKIDQVTLNSVTMMLLDYSTTLDSDVTLTSAILKIDDIELTIGDPLNLAAVEGATITLTLPDNVVNLIQSKLLTDKKVSIDFSASVDKVPVNFTVELSLDVTASGTIL